MLTVNDINFLLKALDKAVQGDKTELEIGHLISDAVTPDLVKNSKGYKEQKDRVIKKKEKENSDFEDEAIILKSKLVQLRRSLKSKPHG